MTAPRWSQNTGRIYAPVLVFGVARDYSCGCGRTFRSRRPLPSCVCGRVHLTRDLDTPLWG